MSNLQKYEGPDGTASSHALFVLFKVAGAEYLLPSDTVLQMESFTGATPVPGAPPFVAGIVHVRGRVVPLIDLGRRFGYAPLVPGPDTRIIVGQSGERVVGLVVDSAREVLKLATSELRPPPAILDFHASGFIKAVAQLGPRVVMLVDFARVIGEERVDVVE